jgi:hypothetical protein
MTKSILQFPNTSLPNATALAINSQSAIKSYKIDFKDTSAWYASDGYGSSKYSTESPHVVGSLIDLTLEITPDQTRDADNHRLRLFINNPDGDMVELNLNAVALDPNGHGYIPGPARSLTGGLLCISESEADMEAASLGARFTILPGRGRGVFIQLDIASNGAWVTMSGPTATMRIPKEPLAFQRELEQIKSRFRRSGFLLPTPAIQKAG